MFRGTSSSLAKAGSSGRPSSTNAQTSWGNSERLCVPMASARVQAQLSLLGLMQHSSTRESNKAYQSPPAPSLGTLKSAFRDRCKTLHPDCGGTEQEFREVTEAYSALLAEHGRQVESLAASRSGSGFYHPGQAPTHSDPRYNKATSRMSFHNEWATSQSNTAYGPPSWSPDDSQTTSSSDSNSRSHDCRSSSSNSSRKATPGSSFDARYRTAPSDSDYLRTCTHVVSGKANCVDSPFSGNSDENYLRVSHGFRAGRNCMCSCTKT